MAKGAVSVVSSRQPTVADSTSVAESIALHVNVKELLWTKHVMGWLLGKVLGEELPVFCDNSTVVGNIQHGEGRHKTKYLDVKYMFAREYVEEKVVKVIWVSTDVNCADIFTKALSRVVVERHSQRLGLRRGAKRVMGNRHVFQDEDTVLYLRDGNLLCIKGRGRKGGEVR